MKAQLRWLAAEGHDWWLLRGATWLPSWLPWRWAWASHRCLARFAHVFPEPVAAASAIAPQHLPIDDLEEFKRKLRTTWLFDTADLQVSRRHAVGWLPGSLEVQGAWPNAGAFVVVSFHYGNGLWLLHALRRHGLENTFVSGRHDRREFGQLAVRFRYGEARMREVARIGGRAPAYRPGVRAQLLQCLREGAAVIGLIDVPPRLAPHGQQPVTLLGQPASLPDGLVRLAAEAGVPIVPCWVEIDFARRRRRLVIGEALAPEPAQSVLAQLAATLDRLIRAEPAAWMFWGEWPGWLRDAAPLHAAGFSNDAARGRLPDSPAAGRSP